MVGGLGFDVVPRRFACAHREDIDVGGAAHYVWHSYPSEWVWIERSCLSGTD